VTPGAAVLHGGPLAGRARRLDRDAIDYGQLFVPAPFHKGGYRQAVYCARLMSTHPSPDATTWTEWHFRGYVKKRPSSTTLAKAAK
jgi:hypothetical protein